MVPKKRKGFPRPIFTTVNCLNPVIAISILKHFQRRIKDEVNMLRPILWGLKSCFKVRAKVVEGKLVFI